MRYYRQEKLPKVTIVTTFHRVLNLNSKSFYNDFQNHLNLDYPDYEILIVSDKKINKIKLPKTRFISTNKKLTGPGEKRDFALKFAKGEIIAFIDDDAYPDRYWLIEAVKHFQDPLVGAVCGPGVTPQEDSYFQKLGGLTLSSEFCSGSTRIRFVPGVKSFVQDHPTYNFMVRKSLFKEIGGFKTTLWCGEDTKLCLSIINANKKILYEPNSIVYHHRRSLFIPHLKQIGNIGLHRGYFAKKYPKTSREIIYFLPSLFMIFVILSIILAVIFPQFIIPIIAIFGLMFYTYFMTTVTRTDPIGALIVSLAIPLTHIAYGAFFIKGLFTRKLDR